MLNNKSQYLQGFREDDDSKKFNKVRFTTLTWWGSLVRVQLRLPLFLCKSTTYDFGWKWFSRVVSRIPHCCFHRGPLNTIVGAHNPAGIDPTEHFGVDMPHLGRDVPRSHAGGQRGGGIGMAAVVRSTAPSFQSTRRGCPVVLVFAPAVVPRSFH